MSSLLPYRENGVGLTRRAWAWAVVPAVVTVVILALTPFPDWMSKHKSLSSLAVLVVIIPPFVELMTVGTAFFHCWLPGIRVTETEVRIGNCRGAERRREEGEPPARVTPRWRTTFVEFAIPVDAIRSARIIDRGSLRTRVAEAWRRRREGPLPRRNLAGFISPFSRTVLQLRVDLAQARLPELPVHIHNQFANRRTSNYFVLTDRWEISTRRPEQLLEALKEAGVPVRQPSESLLAPAQ